MAAVGNIEPLSNLNAITPDGFLGASLAARHAIYNPGAQPRTDLLKPAADVPQTAKDAGEAAVAPTQRL